MKIQWIIADLKPGVSVRQRGREKDIITITQTLLSPNARDSHWNLAPNNLNIVIWDWMTAQEMVEFLNREEFFPLDLVTNTDMIF